MFKFLREILFFVIFSFLGYCVLVYVIGEYGPNYLRKNFLGDKDGGIGFTALKLQNVEKLKDIDLLILGSSHAYRGLDTRIFAENNIKSFNLGTSSQTPIQTEMLLKKYFQRLNPKVVVYEVNPGPFEINGVESAIDILSNLKTIDWQSIKMASKMENIKVYNSTIFYFFKKNLTDSKKYNRKRLKDGVDTYVEYGGYVERNATNDKPVEHISRKLILRQSQMGAFEKSLEILSQTGAEVWLVRTPVTEQLYRSFLNNKQVDQYFSSRGKFINFQEKIQLDDSLDFFDSHHLNQSGASKVTREVIKCLK